MKTTTSQWCGAIILALAAGPATAALSVTSSSDANALAGLISGSGINIVSATLTAPDGSTGSFAGGTSAGIGIEQGLILTTGLVDIAPGPNDQSGATGFSPGGPGDSDLSNIVGDDTFDAAVLEIVFTTGGGDLSFNYSFASEEYDEFVGSEFNDVFAFLLDGENIALIPGTTTPVAINTVNNGNMFDLSVMPSNPQFFMDNVNGDFNIQYDGFTTVFEAFAPGLSAGSHTIKLAIADTSDDVFDSAVFIEGGTFEVIPVPPAALLFVSALGLLGWTRRRHV